MEDFALRRLRPNMRMIVQQMEDQGWNVGCRLQEENASIHSARLYEDTDRLEGDILYLAEQLPEAAQTSVRFCICTRPHPMVPNCIWCPEKGILEITNLVLDLFALCREWEYRINQLVYRNASLTELCTLGSELLENPVCIHDDWFVLSAMSPDLPEAMLPESVLTSSLGFIPQSIMQDLQGDPEYARTFEHRHAHIWQSNVEDSRSMYVNLWDGGVYRGRLLVFNSNREFRSADFPLAEVLTQGAIQLLRKQTSDEAHSRSMDNAIRSLLRGKHLDSADLTQMTNTLHWNRSDRFLCIRVKSQQTQMAVLEHMAHSELFRAFPGSYILLARQEQILLLNLSARDFSFAQISYQLAPLCRDQCLYAGVSSPVAGMQELKYAYLQAGYALEYAFQQRNAKWIVPFSDFALPHIFESLSSSLPPRHMVSPSLYKLIDHDREKDTQYFDTFRTYLRLERDIPKTAERLIIHRTTLQYRLNKIQALMDVDLEDPEQRLYLLISLHLLEQENQ